MNVRDRFFNEIYKKVQSGADIVLVSSDLGAPSLDDFRRDYPQRFVNVGIAEQNSIAVAGGLSLSGKTAITYGLNPFPVTRAFDQVRNIMASLEIPITVAALKAGTATAEAGVSHMALENIALLRTIRNVQIVNPSDETISCMATDEIICNPKPRYIQFDPFISGTLYEQVEIDYKKGFVVTGREYKTAIVTTGIWAHWLKKEKLPVKLIDCFSLPVLETDFCEEIGACNRIITIEDGMIDGGIGSMTLEILNKYNMTVPVERMGISFENGYPSILSNRDMIFRQEGLTMEHVREIVGIP